MNFIPKARFFTFPSNEINLASVRASAQQFRRHGRKPRLGAYTIKDCIKEALALARAEQDERRDSELSSAADAVDAAISALGLDGYGSMEREEAIVAYHRGRPCVLTTGGYHHQGAQIAASAINRGDADLSYFLPAGDRRASMSPIKFAAELIMGKTLRPVNGAARRLFASVARSDRMAA